LLFTKVWLSEPTLQWITLWFHDSSCEKIRQTSFYDWTFRVSRFVIQFHPIILSYFCYSKNEGKVNIFLKERKYIFKKEFLFHGFFFTFRMEAKTCRIRKVDYRNLDFMIHAWSIRHFYNSDGSKFYWLLFEYANKFTAQFTRSRFSETINHY